MSGTRTTALLVLLAAALLAVATPAASQVDEDELARLRSRADRINPRIAELDSEIALQDEAVRVAERRIKLRDMEFELLADDYARAVSARDVPERVSRVAAVDSFVQGDPRAQAVYDEIRTLNGDQTAGRRRQLYDAVVTNAVVRTGVATAALAELATESTEARRVLETLEAQRREAVDARSVLLAERAELVQEARLVNDRLRWLESLDDRWLLTGEEGWDGTERPVLAVKIDNVSAARPQWGINEADIVFEEQVEGGFSRLIAVFHSEGADPVGPVRSVRTSDPRILTNLNQPLLASSGGNAGSLAALAASSLIDVGVNANSSAYYRESSRRAPHNLLSSTDALWAAAGDRGGLPPPVLRFRPPNQALPADATPTSTVRFGYGATDVEYRWDGAGWARWQDGSAHVDAAGVQVAPPNVIIQRIDYGRSQADLNSPEAEMFGTGPALFLVDGHAVEGTWERPQPNEPTVYRDAAGELLHLDVGPTWIALPPVSAPITVE